MEGVGVGESPGLCRYGCEFERLTGWRCSEISPWNECLVGISDAHVQHIGSCGIQKRCAHGLAVGRWDEEGFDFWCSGSGNAKIRSQLADKSPAPRGIELRQLTRPERAGEFAIVVSGEKCDPCPDLPHVGDRLRAVGGGSKSRELSKRERRKNAYYGQDNEQLRECEGFAQRSHSAGTNRTMRSGWLRTI